MTRSTMATVALMAGLGVAGHAQIIIVDSNPPGPRAAQSQVCTVVAPSLTFLPIDDIRSGEPSTMRLTIFNNNSRPCAAVGFAIGVETPSAWTYKVFGSAPPAIASGEAGMGAIGVTAPVQAVPGPYRIRVSVAQVGVPPETFVQTIDGMVIVRRPLNLRVTVTPDKITYSRGTVVTFTILVTADGQPVVGADVLAHVVMPTGQNSGALKAKPTDSRGRSTTTFLLLREASAGAYTVFAQATQQRDTAPAPGVPFQVR